MNIISYSLWGVNPLYLRGAVKNVTLCKQIYPDWVCRFYVDQLVPYSIINELESFGAETVRMGTIANFDGMFYRLDAINQADYVLIRDCDSRPSQREKKCVDEWMASGKGCHTIFDHPAHQFDIMPGLSGFKRNAIPNMKELVESFNIRDQYGIDYMFFNSIKHLFVNNLLVHDGISHRGVRIKDRKKLDFCGKVIYPNGGTVEEHEDVLRNFLDTKERSCYIYHHMGLGDCLDMNAAVRLIAQEHDRVYVFSKKKYFLMIEHMYRDVDNIIVLPVDADTYEEEYQNVYKKIGYNKKVIEVGHKSYPWGRERQLEKGCAELFYDQLGIPFKRRFSEWHLERDLAEEDRVYRKLNFRNEKYVFVHDDPDRGFVISDEKIFTIYGEHVKVIRNDVSENLFHFGKILENAEQLHVMESSFKSLIEVLDVKECYFHNMRSESASGFLGKTRQKWIEV